MKVHGNTGGSHLIVDDDGLELVVSELAFQEATSARSETHHDSSRFADLIKGCQSLQQNALALAEPAYRIVQARADRSEVTHFQAWVNSTSAVVILTDSDAEHVVFGASPLELPSLMAKLTSLGARPRLNKAIQVANSDLDDLFSADREKRSDAFGRIGAAPDGWAWQIQAILETDGPRPTMLGVDSESGLLYATTTDDTGDEVHLIPMATTDVWSDMIRFLIPGS